MNKTGFKISFSIKKLKPYTAQFTKILLFYSLPAVCKQAVLCLTLPSMQRFLGSTTKNKPMTHFYTFMKTYFIQLIPTQWEDSIEMTNNKEQSEHKSSLLNFKVHLCSLQSSAFTRLPRSLCQGSFLRAEDLPQRLQLGMYTRWLAHLHMLYLPKGSFFIVNGIDSFITSFIWKAEGKLEALIKRTQRYPSMYLRSPNSLSVQNRTKEEDHNFSNVFQQTTRCSYQNLVLILPPSQPSTVMLHKPSSRHKQIIKISGQTLQPALPKEEFTACRYWPARLFQFLKALQPQSRNTSACSCKARASTGSGIHQWWTEGTGYNI